MFGRILSVWETANETISQQQLIDLAKRKWGELRRKLNHSKITPKLISIPSQLLRKENYILRECLYVKLSTTYCGILREKRFKLCMIYKTI